MPTKEEEIAKIINKGVDDNAIRSFIDDYFGERDNDNSENEDDIDEGKKLWSFLIFNHLSCFID